MEGATASQRVVMLGHVGGMDGNIIVGLTNVCTTETETSGETIQVP